ALAAFAADAKVQHLLEFGMVEFILLVAVGKELAQSIGTGAGGILFVAGGAVAGAHGPSGLGGLAAIPASVTVLGSTQQARGCTDVRQSRHLRLLSSWLLAREFMRRGRIGDLTGVEGVLRVEGSLHLLQDLVVLLAYHLFSVLPSQSSVTVFPTHRAAVLLHEFSNVFGNFSEEDHVLLLFQVQDRSQVQLSRPGVGVV